MGESMDLGQSHFGGISREELVAAEAFANTMAGTVTISSHAAVGKARRACHDLRIT